MTEHKMSKADPEVLRGHPATGTEDEKDLKSDEKTLSTTISSPTMSATATYLQEATKQEPVIDHSGITFTRLPPEIRNMIYRYVVVSKYDVVDLGRTKPSISGGIETAILSTNKSINKEASKILYDENDFAVVYTLTHGGVQFREDVGLMNRTGLIYKHVFMKLRHIEFQFILFNRKSFCDTCIQKKALYMHGQATELGNLIRDRAGGESGLLLDATRAWTLQIIGLATGRRILSYRIMHKMVLPFLAEHVSSAVERNTLHIELEGTFAPGWEMLLPVGSYTTKDIKVATEAEVTDVNAYLLAVFFEENEVYDPEDREILG